MECLYEKHAKRSATQFFNDGDTNENGISKYVIENKKSGCLIGYPTNNSELYSAFRYLEKNIDTASKEARQAFISNYYYKNFCNTAKAIFEDDKLIVKEG